MLETSTGLQEIYRVLSREVGWEFPEHRQREVEEAVRLTAREGGFADLDSLTKALLQEGAGGKPILNLLTRRLTVRETCFFRDPAVFQALKQQILPDLIRRRASHGRTIRIWSAGCCTGEEAYSLAIAVSHILPASGQWTVEVLGTDLNPDYIARAEAGAYGEWAFRGAPRWLKKEFFSKTGDRSYEIGAKARASVRFLCHNLAAGLPACLDGKKIDLLFCRNVLMYFSAEKTGRVLDLFRGVLADDGILCVAPYEAPRLKESPFAPADSIDGLFFQHRRSEEPSTPGRSAPVGSPPVSFPPPRRRRSRPPVIATADRLPANDSVPAVSSPVSEAVPPACKEVRRLAGEGRLWEALQKCDALIASNRLDPNLHYLKAAILLEGGKARESVAALRQTLYLQPDFILAHLALANLARSDGKHGQADRRVTRLRQMLSKRPAEEPVPASEGLTVASLLAMLPSSTEIS